MNTKESEYIIEEEALREPHCAFSYANDILQDRFPKGEPMIAKDPYWSIAYVRDILKPALQKKSISELIDILEEDPLDMVKDIVLEMLDTTGSLKESESTLTEEEALKDPYWAYMYAKDVIKDRWPEGEPTIAKDPDYAYYYARYVLKDRWPKGEPIIAKDPEYAYLYAKDVIKDRWPEGEPTIAKDPDYAYYYARYVLKDRWPKGEPIIAKDPKYAYAYAKYIIKPLLKKKSISELIDILEEDPIEMVKDIVLEMLDTTSNLKESNLTEEEALQDPRNAYFYARYIIKDRWPKGEPIIAKDSYHAYLYAAQVLGSRFPEGEFSIAKGKELSYLYIRDILKPSLKKKSISELIDILEENPVDMVKEAVLQLLQTKSSLKESSIEIKAKNVIDFIISEGKGVKKFSEFGDWISLRSSTLDEVRYDPDSETLEVTFNSDATYTYDRVPEQVFESLLDAMSHGSYFYYNIRMEYPYERIAGLGATPKSSEIQHILSQCLSERDWDFNKIIVEKVTPQLRKYRFQTTQKWNKSKERGFYINRETYRCLNHNLSINAENKSWGVTPVIKELYQESKPYTEGVSFGPKRTDIIITLLLKPQQLELDV